MKIKQLSVFLENKTGRINEVTRILGRNGINMQAFSMAETADFGILRLVVPEVEKAAGILRAADFAVMTTEVLCITCENVPGALSSILERLASEKIFIEYMYAFSDGDKANVVIRTNDIDRSIQILGDCPGCTSYEF